MVWAACNDNAECLSDGCYKIDKLTV